MSKQSKEYWKEYYSKNKAKRLQNAENSRLRLKYGTTQEEVNLLEQKQNYKCAICDSNFKETKLNKRGIPIRKMHIDHCHKSGKMRELLCNKCNKGLGSFNDDENIIRNALNYIIKHSRNGS